ncbi:MAG: glycoside hydrolase [Candidatus Omnitrophica bacterium]|nr:glycoside hydrolase [Candidatus Omnitrophota bacterium]
MNDVFEIIDSGFVFNAEKDTDHAVACGPRCLVTTEDIICSFMVQSGLGINDFKPVLMRSYEGKKWQDMSFPWKHLSNQYSIFGSISCSNDGEIFFFGTRTKIDIPGESFWRNENQGLKENELVYARSLDNGKTWTEFSVIPKPFLCSAEAPGAMCITKSGSWHVCYSPYNTFDSNNFVERNQVVLLTSRDKGKTWSYTRMLSFEELYSSAAEAWVVELADGRLFGTCWKINQKNGSDFSNPYAVSEDDGRTWSKTQPTGIMGQTPALAPLPDGRIFFIYNQRRVPPYGIRLALISVLDVGLRIDADEMIYCVEKPSIDAFLKSHSDWTNFNFGEPHVAILPDKTILAVFWCIEPENRGIRYIRLDAKNMI